MRLTAGKRIDRGKKALDCICGQYSTCFELMTRRLSASRPPIPKNIERQVLFRNQSVCCVCQKSGVQIHHIDGNPSNNALSNLCVLCIAHHAKASSKSTMLKHLSAALLRQYKAAWEGRVALIYQLAAAKRTERPSQFQRRQMGMEIKRVIFRLHGEKSAKQVDAALNYLYAWSLLEDGKKEVIDTFASAHWILELSTLRILLRRLHEFFWEFVGPEYVSMTAKKERQLIEAIKLVGGIGYQAAVFEAQEAFFGQVGKALSEFAAIAKVYRRKKLMDAIRREVDAIKKEGNDAANQHRMKRALRNLDRALTDLQLFS